MTGDRKTGQSFKLAEVCERQQFGFGEPLDKNSAQDNFVVQRFGAACGELLRQGGLDFGAGQTTYTCRVFLPRVTEMPSPDKLKEYETQFKDKNEFNLILSETQKQVADNDNKLLALERAFGKRLSLSSFNDDMQNPEDIIRQYRQQGKATQSLKGVAIGYSSTFAGLAATLILLSDPDGKVDRVLYSQDELDEALRGVRSLAGAMDLISMRKLAGMENDMLHPGNHPYPLCNTGSINEDRAGWTIQGVEILPQCANSALLDYRVLRTGETIPANLRSPTKPKRLCVD